MYSKPHMEISNVQRIAKVDHLIFLDMQALARAIVPDETAGRPPQATMAALKRLEEALVAELSAGDLDSQEDGPADSECLKSFGYRRLAAAAGLLRLARIYDSHLAVDSFLQLALSIQVRFPCNLAFS